MNKLKCIKPLNVDPIYSSSNHRSCIYFLKCHFQSPILSVLNLLYAAFLYSFNSNMSVTHALVYLVPPSGIIKLYLEL